MVINACLFFNKCFPLKYCRVIEWFGLGGILDTIHFQAPGMQGHFPLGHVPQSTFLKFEVILLVKNLLLILLLLSFSAFLREPLLVFIYLFLCINEPFTELCLETATINPFPVNGDYGLLESLKGEQ